jgi:hypothetical protein
MRFRMSVDASVCFDVIAGSEEEAIAQAKKVCLELEEGADVIEGGNREMRVYLDSDAKGLDICDIEED